MTLSFRPQVTAESTPPPVAVVPGQVLVHLALENSLDAVIARTTVRKLAAEPGFDLVEQVRIATAVFEIAI